MSGAVYFMDLGLAHFGLHAESTYLDDTLLGMFAAFLVFFLQLHHERELRRQQQCAAVIDNMNHHIRNALQVIVYRATLDAQYGAELKDINKAIERIDWALREILPEINRAGLDPAGSSSYNLVGPGSQSNPSAPNVADPLT